MEERLMDSELYDILWDESPNFPIFYQVDRLIRCSTPITCQKDSTLYFQKLLEEYFSKYNSQEAKPEMRQGLGNYICSFFKIFKDEKVTPIENGDTRWKFYEGWGICTQLALYHSFVKLAESQNLDLYKSTTFEIDDQVCLALKEEFYKNFPDYSLPLLYKLPLESILEEKESVIYFRTTLERTTKDELFNKEFFVKDFIEYYNEIQEHENKKAVHVSALEYLEQQFSYYTKTIRQSGCYDANALRLAAMYWRYSTNTLIKRQSTIQQLDILIRHNLSGKSIIDGFASRKAIDATNAINELKNECISYVNTMLDSYVEELNKVESSSSWIDRLTDIGINYTGLYSSLKGEYFSQSITMAGFKDAFISADFLTLYSESKKKGRSNCILYMIKQLRKHLGDEWTYHSALSIYPTCASGKDAFRRLDKNANDGQSKKHGIEDILIANIQIFKKSRRSKA